MIKLFEEEEPPFVECEIPTMNELQAKGVPGEEWPYYIGYMKRMLVLYRAYTGATLQLEKTNLIEEYVLRGKDRDVLEQVQTVTEVCAGIVVSCEDVRACLEGDFSAWAVYDSFDDPHSNCFGDWRQHAIVNREETDALLVEETNDRVKKYAISTKALGAVLADTLIIEPALEKRAKSAYGTYTVFNRDYNEVKIFKNGDLVQTLTNVQLGIAASEIRTVSISPRGKYIFVSGKRVASGACGWVVLEGS